MGWDPKKYFGRCLGKHAGWDLKKQANCVVYERIKDDVFTCPLTPELADTLREQINHAWTGDGTCSAQNMQFSCFASEYCSACMAFPTRCLTFQGSKYEILAIDDANAARNFAGFVRADAPGSLMRTLFPSACTADAIFITSLCVAPAYRNNGPRGYHGIGKRLLQYITSTCGSPLFLTVKTSEEGKGTPEVHAHMQERAATLVQMYRNLGFVLVDTRRGHTLMQYCNPTA